MNSKTNLGIKMLAILLVLTVLIIAITIKLNTI